jgi:hypothetical protein
LLDGQAEHPDGLVIRMPDLPHHILQSSLLAAKLMLEKLAPALELP